VATDIELSVVVPVYNEAECIAEFHRRLGAVLDGLDVESEILYVDDGSQDASVDILGRIEGSDPRVDLVRLSRNFGHQVAVSAGLDLSRGAAVVVIDADLQDPPELISELVARWKDGVEVVNAVRTERKGESAFKLATARWFYRLIRRWTDLDLQVDAGDFRLMDRVVVDALCDMPERYRFIRGMVAWVGFRQEAVGYQRDERYAGTSKYPLRSMLRLALTAITSFSFVPLQIGAFIGFLIAAFALVAVPVVIVLRLLGERGLGGQTTVLIAILFFGGLQLAFLGVLGEYLGRLYIEAKQRPLYVLRNPGKRTRSSDDGA
jgi:polyisoprenyl-phosphate glycosyltransferase